METLVKGMDAIERVVNKYKGIGDWKKQFSQRTVSDY